MRALVVRTLGSVDGASVETVEAPQAGAGDVIVRVRAAPLNFVDMLILEGKYQERLDLPYVPGREIAGTVTAVGTGVTRFQPGDRVLAFVAQGAFAEEAVVPEADCTAIPDGMADVEASCLGMAYQTAHFALVDRARTQAGETVLVTGASGAVGIAAIQIAKALGAQALAGLLSMEKASLVTKAGADHVVDLGGDDIKDAVRDQVYGITGKRGANVVLECIGGHVFEACLRATAWEGRVVDIGFAGGAIPAARVNYLLVKNIAVIGLYWGSYRQYAPDRVAAAQQAIFDGAVAGRLKPSIMTTLPLDRYREAFAHMANRTMIGRIVFTFPEA